jgi:hypothetical protein
MLLQRNDNTFDGGSLDVICILRNINKNTYHAAFFEEHPMPAEIPSIEDTKIVRLKSKFHHTEGSATLERAIKHLYEISERIHILQDNIWLEPQDWDGELGIVWIVPNWKN